MKLSDEAMPEPGDVKIVERVRDHAEVIERAVPVISGSDIRHAPTATLTAIDSRLQRSRRPFLAAAAAAVVIVGGGIAAVTLGNDNAGTDTQVEAADSLDVTADATNPSTTEAAAEATTEVDEAPAQEDGPVDMMPIPVTAADFGTADMRLLPPPDSDFTVATGSRLLLSESDIPPAVATPVRTQRVALPTVDPADRRAILIIVSTYADEAEADALIAAEPTAHGSAGDPADIDGLPGAWHEEEGFAPFSAGNPMQTIRTLRLRLDPTTVLDVATPDVSRAEIEALVGSLTFSDDGTLGSPTPPAGFAEAEPIDGLSPRAVINDPAASDYLSLTLVGLNGEQVELTVSPETAGLSPAGAHFEDGNGYGWVEAGLFGEKVVSLVTADATLILHSYDGLTSADDLVALARSIEPVDDETWAERLAIAPLYDAPVMAAPIDE